MDYTDRFQHCIFHNWIRTDSMYCSYNCFERVKMKGLSITANVREEEEEEEEEEDEEEEEAEAGKEKGALDFAGEAGGARNNLEVEVEMVGAEEEEEDDDEEAEDVARGGDNNEAEEEEEAGDTEICV